MHPEHVRQEAQRLLGRGLSPGAVGRALGLPRATVRDWQDGALPTNQKLCPRCHHDRPMDRAAYAGLLGFYLGDGCIARLARTYTLR